MKRIIVTSMAFQNVI